MIQLPLSPVTEIGAARLRAADGSATVLDTSLWQWDGTRLRVNTRPAVLRPFAGIEIDLDAGYGGAEDVPPGFLQPIRLLAAHWYEHRASASREGMDALPLAVATLIAPERALRV